MIPLRPGSSSVSSPGSTSLRVLRLAGLSILFGALASCASAGSGESGPTEGTISIRNASPSGGGGRIQLELTNDPMVREATLNAPLADVWAILPAVFATLEIEAPVISPGTLQIGNPEFTPRRIEGRRLSRYLACGNVAGGSRADRYEVTMQFVVGLSDAPDGTLVRTTLDAYARPRDVSGNAVHCTSQGTLEQRVVDLVAERLAEVGAG